MSRTDAHVRPGPDNDKLVGASDDLDRHERPSCGSDIFRRILQD